MKSMNHHNNHFVLLALCGLVVMAAGCSSTEGKTPPDTLAAPVVPVTEAFVLTKGNMSTTLQTPGELVAHQQVDLYAKENSFVKKLYVDIGSEVREGQLLATLDAPELNSRLAAAESRLKSQEAIYTASKAQYDRLYETSKTPGTISQNDLDQAEARRNSDLAQLEAARAAQKEVLITRGYLAIWAPFSGVISSRNVNLGAYVGPSGKGSEQPMFTLQEQKKLRLVVSVPEAYTRFLDEQHAVDFQVKALPGKVFKAMIKRQAGALDDRLRSQRVEMDVINNDKKLLPGMIAEVHIPFPGKDSTFIVPKTAVVNATERVFVIRLVNNKAEWVDVQKGREINGKTEIYGQLASGDQLVTIAGEEVRNGAEIKHVKVSGQAGDKQ